MKRRTVIRWAARQYSGDVQPWPLWVRVAVIAVVLILLQCQLAGKRDKLRDKTDAWINHEYGNNPQLVEVV